MLQHGLNGHLEAYAKNLLALSDRFHNVAFDYVGHGMSDKKVESFPDYIGRHLGAPWPSMAPAQACHRHVMVSGSVYRTVSHQCWDCAQRRADMKGMGISRQVLSPMPELLSYWLEPEDGAAMCRFPDLVYDAATIHRLIDVFGITQIMAGSDYPFTIMDPDPAARLAGLGLGTEALGLLRNANAMRWLGRDAS